MESPRHLKKCYRGPVCVGVTQSCWDLRSEDLSSLGRHSRVSGPRHSVHPGTEEGQISRKRYYIQAQEYQYTQLHRTTRVSQLIGLMNSQPRSKRTNAPLASLFSHDHHANDVRRLQPSGRHSFSASSINFPVFAQSSYQLYTFS